MTVTKTDATVVISLKPTKGIGPEVLNTGFTKLFRDSGKTKSEKVDSGKRETKAAPQKPVDN
jgi:hypothetical protein